MAYRHSLRTVIPDSAVLLLPQTAKEVSPLNLLYIPISAETRILSNIALAGDATLPLTHFLAAAVAASATLSTVEQRLARPDAAALTQSARTVSCGTHFYDDGVPENTLFFQGGGHAGEPDHFFAVKFVLEDFNLLPGQVIIDGFCAGNTFDLGAAGGPWPNEIFLYPDNGGVPDLNQPLRQSTMVTGDGRGDFIGQFPQPALITGDFWLLNQGYPPHAGEDFNMETDQSSEPQMRSYITDRGLPFVFQTEQNLILRALLRGAPVPQAVPSLALYTYLILIIGLTLLTYRRLQQRSIAERR